ncbi:unnamed protein product [Acanthoscelides obtectus]|uniref:Uncharacterized protein n=1 Tax=Acanthoscelides obtectus TaxID=200917 RepID=A0A9P0P9T9_ACAOB|nr:unnamed protein product [Acanthoscelides obtectus]CAK1666717.1 hypothetical protein AOBTE_LOCUS25450 [Acanthoscelides obtectus]
MRGGSVTRYCAASVIGVASRRSVCATKSRHATRFLCSAIKAVKARIQRNPLRKQKILSREMKIPVRTMSRIIKQDLGLGAYRRHNF